MARRENFKICKIEFIDYEQKAQNYGVNSHQDQTKINSIV